MWDKSFCAQFDLRSIILPLLDRRDCRELFDTTIFSSPHQRGDPQSTGETCCRFIHCRVVGGQTSAFIFSKAATGSAGKNWNLLDSIIDLQILYCSTETLYHKWYWTAGLRKCPLWLRLLMYWSHFDVGKYSAQWTTLKFTFVLSRI